MEERDLVAHDRPQVAEPLARAFLEALRRVEACGAAAAPDQVREGLLCTFVGHPEARL